MARPATARNSLAAPLAVSLKRAFLLSSAAVQPCWRSWRWIVAYECQIRPLCQSRSRIDYEGLFQIILHSCLQKGVQCAAIRVMAECLTPQHGPKTMLQSGGGVRTLPLAIGGGGMFVKTTRRLCFQQAFLNRKHAHPVFNILKGQKGPTRPR